MSNRKRAARPRLRVASTKARTTMNRTPELRLSPRKPIVYVGCHLRMSAWRADDWYTVVITVDGVELARTAVKRIENLSPIIAVAWELWGQQAEGLDTVVVADEDEWKAFCELDAREAHALDEECGATAPKPCVACKKAMHCTDHKRHDGAHSARCTCGTVRVYR